MATVADVVDVAADGRLAISPAVSGEATPPVVQSGSLIR